MDRRVTVAPRGAMPCPVCGYESLEGADECDNCGTDLRSLDLAQPPGVLEARLARDQLEDVRARAPVWVAPDTPVRFAVRTMQEELVDCLLVGEQGRLAGIITDHDALVRLAGRSLDGLRASDVMTRDPVVLRAGDSLAVAVHKMAMGGFRHVPLVEEGRVVGIVTARDLFRHVAAILS